MVAITRAAARQQAKAAASPFLGLKSSMIFEKFATLQLSDKILVLDAPLDFLPLADILRLCRSRQTKVLCNKAILGPRCKLLIWLHVRDCHLQFMSYFPHEKLRARKAGPAPPKLCPALTPHFVHLMDMPGHEEGRKIMLKRRKVMLKHKNQFLIGSMPNPIVLD